MENFVAHGFEHRVVELEERELRAAASVVGVIVFRRRRKHLSVVGIVRLELVENGFGALHNTVGHTGQTRHMDTERMFRTAARQFAEKDNAVIYFAHRDIVVLDAREAFFHVVQLVIVGGKEGAGVHFRPFVKMLHNAPRDGDAVVGRGAASQFVEEHQTALRDVVHDVRRLAHFDHEGTFAHRDIVRSPHAGEDFVDHPHTCRVGGDERTDLRHQCDERRLAEQRTLTRHVRAGDDDDLLLLGVEQDIVRHIFFARRHEGFDHGVASGLDVEHFALVHHRTHVALRHGQAGKGVIDVQLG